MLEIRVLIKFDISKTLIASYCWRKKKRKKNISKTSQMGSFKIRNCKPVFVFQSEKKNLCIHFLILLK